MKTSKKPSSEGGTGYKNPPKAHQFKKGKSGNPSGRPRGAKTKTGGDHNRIFKELLDESRRTVGVKEGSSENSMSLVRAMLRAMGAAGAKGDFRAQKEFIRIARELEKEKSDERQLCFKLASEYKAYWTEELRRREEQSLKGEEPIPHPRNIHLNYKTCEVTVVGPLDKEHEDLIDTVLRWKISCEVEIGCCIASLAKGSEYVEVDIAQLKHAFDLLKIFRRILDDPWPEKLALPLTDLDDLVNKMKKFKSDA